METHNGNHYVLFQFTPLREGRLVEIVKECAEYEFQFTPLREGRQGRMLRMLQCFEFQFTPLREGRLVT